MSLSANFAKKYASDKGTVRSTGGSSSSNFLKNVQSGKIIQREPQQQNTTQSSLIEQVAKKNLITKAKDYLQNVGFKQQQNTGLISKASKFLTESIFPSNDKVLELAQDDLVKKIYERSQRGENTKKEQNSLLLLREAIDPKADPKKKSETATMFRLGRVGTDFVTGTANFASSVLDTVTQYVEQQNVDNAKVYDDLYKKTGDEVFKKQSEKYASLESKPKEIITRKQSNKIKKWASENATTNPVFSEKVVGSTSSMVGFGLLALATKGRISAFAESMIEGSSTYEELRNQGKSIQEASQGADRTLLANLILNNALNVFDLKDQDIPALKKALKGLTLEGFQEGGQQIIQNINTGVDWHEGVLEAMGIGAVLGAGAGAVLPGGVTETTTKKPEVQPLKLDGVDKVTSDKVQELNKLDANNPIVEDENITRVYQAVGKGQETNYVFKSPEELARFKSNTTSESDVFRAVDIKSEDLIKSEVKGDEQNPVYTIKENAEILNRLETKASKPAEVETPTPVKPDGKKLEEPKIEVIPGKKAVKPTKNVTISRDQMPVETKGGDIKISRLEARIKQSLGSLSKEQIDKMGLATHREMNKAENIAKASKYVIENPEQALQVLQGKIDAPKGILKNSIYVAMTKMDIKDLGLATRLATLSSTRAGQEISILTEIDKNQPVNILSDIIKVQTKNIEKKYGGKSTNTIIKSKVKTAKNMIKAKVDWDAILQKVRC